mmetsp:Transcript_3347/g.13365  ORF Transcript_3347/g.13365 Transcript_3347/m.13365 type:complete len:593 (-) Transcript_3347:180-1958(-)
MEAWCLCKSANPTPPKLWIPSCVSLPCEFRCVSRFREKSWVDLRKRWTLTPCALRRWDSECTESSTPNMHSFVMRLLSFLFLPNSGSGCVVRQVALAPTFLPSRKPSYISPYLKVDRLIIRGHAGLLQGLAQRRVRVASAGDVLRGRAILHAQDGFRDHLAGVRADDVHAEDAVGARVRQHLDEAVDGLDGARAAVGREGEGSLVVRDARLLELVLRLAHVGKLGHGVDHAGDGVVVDVASISRQRLDHRDAFLLGLVGQHGAVDDVADGVHALHLRAEVVVHGNAAEAVGLDAEVLQAQVVGEGPAAGGDQHDVHVHLLRVSALAGLHGHLDAAGGHLRVGDLRAELEVDALLLQDLLKLLGYLRVHARRAVVEELDHGHVRAEAAPDGAHLQADDTRPDDDHLLRHGLELQGARGVHDPLARVVHGRGRQRRGLGAGGDDDVLRLDHLVAAVQQAHIHGLRVLQGAEALDVVHAILLEEVLDAAREPHHRVLLVGHHGGQVELDAGQLDAMSRELVVGLLIQVRRVQQRLAGNAAHVQAGAAEPSAALDARRLHPQLRGLDRSHVATRTASDYADVIVISGDSAGGEEAQ